MKIVRIGSIIGWRTAILIPTGFCERLYLWFRLRRIAKHRRRWKPHRIITGKHCYVARIYTGRYVLGELLHQGRKTHGRSQL